MTRKPITSDNLSAPAGPFSLAIRGESLMFVSGQVGQDPTTGALIDGDVVRQTEQALRNLAAVLEAAGKSLGDVLRVSVYLTDMITLAMMNEVYLEHFEPPYPVRTAIRVAALPLGAAVEIDAMVG